MCSRNQTRDIEQLDGNRSFTLDARAVVWFAAIRNLITGTSTRDLKIANCSLRIDCGKWEVACDRKSVKLLNRRLHGLADFRSCICQAVQRCRFAGRGFAHQAYEGISRHDRSLGHTQGCIRHLLMLLFGQEEYYRTMYVHMI